MEVMKMHLKCIFVTSSMHFLAPLEKLMKLCSLQDDESLDCCVPMDRT